MSSKEQDSRLLDTKKVKVANENDWKNVVCFAAGSIGTRTPLQHQRTISNTQHKPSIIAINSIMNDQLNASKPEPTLKNLLTKSTIYNRHRRRREKTLAKQEDSRTPIARVLSQVPVFNQALLPHQLETDTVFTTTTEWSTVNPQVSLPLVLGASAFAGAGAEFLFGRRSKPTKVSNLFATMQSSGTIAFQQETVLRNQQRAIRMAFAASSASLLFGTKQLLDNQMATSSNGDAVVSSAAAGAILATVYTPLLNTRAHMASYRIPTFSNAAMSLMRSQQLLFQNAPRVYAREIAGAVVLFGTYESLKGTNDKNEHPPSTASIMMAGGVSGALYKSITFHFEANQQIGRPLLRGFAPSVARGIPTYMILFLGYESALSMATH